MKSCTKCLTTETADTVGFGEGGVCTVCTQVSKKFSGVVDWDKRRVLLDGLVEKAKARKDDFDLIIPFSGGKDSTFQLWFAVTQLKLKPLVVRYNHWGYRPVVEENNVRTFKKLGVDVIDYRVNWRVVVEMMKETLMRKGDSCVHCHTGVSTIPIQIALKWRIPLVMYGESLAEYQSWGYDIDGFEEWDEVRFNRAMSTGIRAEDLYDFLEGRVEKRDLAPFVFPPKQEIDALGIKAICLGNYIQWDTKGQVEIIKRELGWRGDEVEGIPPEFDYEKIECQFQGVRDWLKFIKRGFGRTNHLANIEIRHGRMSRTAAEVMAACYDGAEPASLGWFLQTVGITREEFYEIAASHVVDPWEGVDPDNVRVGKPLHDQSDWV